MKVYSEGSDGFEPLSSGLINRIRIVHWLISSPLFIKIKLIKEWELSGKFRVCQNNDKFVEMRLYTYIRKFFLVKLIHNYFLSFILIYFD